MLKGANINLRAIEPEDIDSLLMWENNPNNWVVSNTYVPFSRKLLEDYIANAQDIFSAKQVRFIIEDNQTKKALGCIDLFDFDPFNLRAGVGILIEEDFQHKGIAFEALNLLISHSFKYLKLNQLFCSIGASNNASISLFNKANFIQTGKKKEWINNGNTWEDELFFQLIPKKN